MNQEKVKKNNVIVNFKCFRIAGSEVFFLIMGEGGRYGFANLEINFFFHFLCLPSVLFLILFLAY